MVIAISDIKFYKSTPSTGSSQNLGGAISAVEIDKNQLPNNPIFNQIFRDFTNNERSNGSRQYHCFFVKNTHATLTATNGKLWFSSVTPNPETYARMGLETNTKTTPAHTIPNDITEPSGIDLDTRHNAKSEAIDLPSLAPNDYVGIWVAIEVRPNSGQYNKDSWEIRIDLTSPA